MKKNILIVGFGNMGCRHVQAVLQEKEKYDVHVFEPFEEMINRNLERIGAAKSDCSFYTSLDALPQIDLAIIATSSGPRFEIVKKLLNKRVNYFLLEKIVFQSTMQFDEILQLAKDKGAALYCNFVNRYFAAYDEIKKAISNLPGKLRMKVYGNAFGLGCNSIHYIDIFQYLTNNNAVLITGSSLNALEEGNRRGKEYMEFDGSLSVTNSAMDSLHIISDRNFSGGIVVSIEKNDTSCLLSEQTGRWYHASEDKIREGDFGIKPTSKLSNIIIREILNGNCRLTTLEQTSQAHSELFRHFNTRVFGNHTPELVCPIT